MSPVLVLEEERSDNSVYLLSAVLVFTGLYIVSLFSMFLKGNIIALVIFWLFLLPFLSTFSNSPVFVLEWWEHVDEAQGGL